VARSLLGRLLPKAPAAQDPEAESVVGRILVVRQDSRLGNLLLLTPLLRALRLAFPQAGIDVLTSEAYDGVFVNNPCVDRVLVLPKKMFWPDPRVPFRLVASLRQSRYALAFDASARQAFSLTSAVLTALSGARLRVGFPRGEADRFLNRLIVTPEFAHETEILAGLLTLGFPQFAPVDSNELRPEYHVLKEEEIQAKKLWKEWGLNDKVVVLFVGARADKRWPLQNFVALAESLKQEGWSPVFFGGPAEADALKEFKLPEGIFMVPPLPLRTFAAVIARCKAFVSGDTGPMHLAVALGVPTIEIFLKSETWRFGYGHLPGNQIVDGRTKVVEVSDVLAAFRRLQS
jgi:ADP-heptose:LPS heptosyltransferase